MKSEIHQLICTHCSYATALDHQRTDPDAKKLVFEDSARAGSVSKGEGHATFLRFLPGMYYEPPKDSPDGKALEAHNHATMPVRLVYAPGFGRASRFAARVVFRAKDSIGRESSRENSCYFAHVLFDDSAASFSGLDVLKLWETPDWLPTDRADLPFGLPKLDSLRSFTRQPVSLVNDSTLLTWLTHQATTPPPGPIGQLISPRWWASPPAERQRLLIHLMTAWLEQREQGNTPRILLAAEPATAALLFYGLLRLLPPELTTETGFSTFETNLTHSFLDNLQLVATCHLNPETTQVISPPRNMRVINTFRELPPGTPSPAAEHLIRALTNPAIPGQGWKQVDELLSILSAEIAGNPQALQATIANHEGWEKLLDPNVPLARQLFLPRSPAGQKYIRDIMLRQLQSPTYPPGHWESIRQMPDRVELLTQLFLSESRNNPAEQKLQRELLAALDNRKLLQLLQPAAGPVRSDLLDKLKDSTFPAQRLDEFLKDQVGVLLLVASEAGNGSQRPPDPSLKPKGNGPQRPPDPSLKLKPNPEQQLEPKLMAALACFEADYSNHLRNLRDPRKFSEWLKYFLLEYKRLPLPAQWLWDELSGPAGSRFDAFLKASSLTELNLITAGVAAEPGIERLSLWLNWLEAAAAGHPPAEAQVRELLKRLDHDRLFALLKEKSTRAILLNRWDAVKDRVVSGLTARLDGLIQEYQIGKLAESIGFLEDHATLMQPQQPDLLQPHQRLTLGEWEIVLDRLRDLQRVQFAQPGGGWSFLKKSTHGQEEKQLEAAAQSLAKALWKLQLRRQPGEDADYDAPEPPDDVQRKKAFLENMLREAWSPTIPLASRTPLLHKIRVHLETGDGKWSSARKPQSAAIQNATALPPATVLPHRAAPSGSNRTASSTGSPKQAGGWVDYRQLEKDRVRAGWLKFGACCLLAAGLVFATVKFGPQLRDQIQNQLGNQAEVAKNSVSQAEQPKASQPAENRPGNTQPGNTQPGNTQPGNTQPANTQPANTQPGNTQPGNTQPGNTQPANTQPANTQPANTQPANTQPANTQPANTQPANTQPATPQPPPPDHGFVTEVEFVQRFHQVDREFLKPGRDIWETLAVPQPLKWSEVAAPLLNIPADRPAPRSVLVRGLGAANEWLAQQKRPRLLAKYSRVKGVLNVELRLEPDPNGQLLARLTLKDRSLTYQAESGADPAVLNALSAFAMLEFLPQDATQEPYYAQLHRPVPIVLANLADASYPTVAQLLSQSQPQPYFSRFWLHLQGMSIQQGNLKDGLKAVPNPPNQIRLSATNIKLLFDSNGTFTREATTTNYDFGKLKAEVAKAAPDKKPRLEALLLQVQTLETDIAALQGIQSQMQTLKYEAPQGNSPGGFMYAAGKDGSKHSLKGLWNNFFNIWSKRFHLAEAATSNPPPSGVFWIGMMYNQADLSAYHQGLTELKNKEGEYNNQVKLLDNPQLPDDQRQKLTADRDKYQREADEIGRRLIDPTLLGGLHQFAGSLEEKIKQWMKNPRDRYWANYPYSGYQTYLKKAIEHWDAECINRQCGEARIAERFQARKEDYLAQINLDARTGIEDRKKDIQATKKDIKDQIWDAPVSESSPNANIVLEYRYELFADLYRMVVDSAITVLQTESRQKSMELAGELGLTTGAQAPSGSLQGTVYAVVPDQGQRLMIRVIVPPGAQKPGN